MVSSEPVSTTLIEGQQLGLTRDYRDLFDGVDLLLEPGDCLYVKGPNGSGKSSFLRMLCGLLE